MIDESDIHGGNILIVDDKEANVFLLDRMLQGAGYTSVSSTVDPTVVCELHRKNCYDLILLDLQMPGMDGFEVMEGLKQIENDNYLPVLVITAQPEHKLRALNAGAKDFVTKPFDLAEVLTRVHNMLEVRLLQKETRRLYDRVKEEQLVSQELLRRVLPRSIAERFKADHSISELLRFASMNAAGAGADPRELYRRSSQRTVEQIVALTILTAAVGAASWWSLKFLPTWGRVLGTAAICVFFVALRFEWNRRFVAGEMQAEARARAASAPAEQTA